MRKMMMGLLTVALSGACSLAAPPEPAPSQCFFVRSSWSWKVQDARTMYIRVDGDHYFRLDMAVACPALVGFDPRLVTVFRSDSVCAAQDWDLSVQRSQYAPPVPCIVRKMTPLSAPEAASIPAKFKPR